MTIIHDKFTGAIRALRKGVKENSIHYFQIPIPIQLYTIPIEVNDNKSFFENVEMQYMMDMIVGIKTDKPVLETTQYFFHMGDNCISSIIISQGETLGYFRDNYAIPCGMFGRDVTNMRLSTMCPSDIGIYIVAGITTIEERNRFNKQYTMIKIDV